MAPYSTSFHLQQQPADPLLSPLLPLMDNPGQVSSFNWQQLLSRMHQQLQSYSFSPAPIIYKLPPLEKETSFSLKGDWIKSTSGPSFIYHLDESNGSTEFFGVGHQFKPDSSTCPLAFSSVEKDHYEIRSSDKTVDKVSKVATGFSITISYEPEKPISLNDQELLKKFDISQSKVRISALVVRICTAASVVFMAAAIALQITRPHSAKLSLIPLALSIIGAIGASYKNRYDSLDLATIILNIRATACQLRR